MQQKKLIQVLIKKLNKSFQSKKFYYPLIFFFSSFISIFYGYRGVFPIDSFIIFDSGFKVLNNFHPFKDYWSITGPLLDYLQAAMFFLFGINWFSYVLHSALINSLLATFAFYAFSRLTIGLIHSLIFSICIAVLAYPVIGLSLIHI